MSDMLPFVKQKIYNNKKYELWKNLVVFPSLFFLYVLIGTK